MFNKSTLTITTSALILMSTGVAGAASNPFSLRQELRKDQRRQLPSLGLDERLGFGGAPTGLHHPLRHVGQGRGFRGDDLDDHGLRPRMVRRDGADRFISVL